MSCRNRTVWAAHGITFEELEKAVAQVASNSTSGYLTTPTQEIMVLISP